jgi:hypothetical protein
MREGNSHPQGMPAVKPLVDGSDTRLNCRMNDQSTELAVIVALNI